MFFQSFFYFLGFVFSFSFDEWGSLVCDLLCFLKTEIEHFSENLDDLNLLTWIDWCQLDFPNLLDNLFLVLGSVLFIFRNKNGRQQVSLLPIFLDPLILVHKLQWRVLVSIQRVYFVYHDTLSTFQGSLGLQLVEVR